MAVVYLSLGSNVGNRQRNIARAMKHLVQNDISIKQSSSVIETKPVGGPDQGKFLNAVLETTTNLTPEDLLIRLKTIEKQLGRKKTIRNGPRTIDIDILLYGEKTITTKWLTVPHPRMHKRKFVMNPLCEIAPKLAERINKKYNLL